MQAPVLHSHLASRIAQMYWHNEKLQQEALAQAVSIRRHGKTTMPGLLGNSTVHARVCTHLLYHAIRCKHQQAQLTRAMNSQAGSKLLCKSVLKANKSMTVTCRGFLQPKPGRHLQHSPKNLLVINAQASLWLLS